MFYCLYLTSLTFDSRRPPFWTSHMIMVMDCIQNVLKYHNLVAVNIFFTDTNFWQFTICNLRLYELLLANYCSNCHNYINWWKGTPSRSTVCTRKRQPRFYWSLIPKKKKLSTITVSLDFKRITFIFNKFSTVIWINIFNNNNFWH